MTITPSQQKIGEVLFPQQSFPETAELIAKFTGEKFQAKNCIERTRKVNQTLYKLIDNSDRNFLLPEVIHFLEEITKNKVLDGNFNLTAFENWINQHSPVYLGQKRLNAEKNRQFRAKIIGKYIPRIDYQSQFPVGQDKIHPGSHTVTAHNPPDLDSTTASYVGWMDAFGCHIGESLTVWNVPQGRPGPVISKMFDELFSPAIFERVAKAKSTVTHVAMDLVQQNNLIKVKASQSIREYQHDRNRNHIIMLDDEGYYLGDWRVADVESVGRVQRLLNICMHIYEKNFIACFTQLFSQEKITRTEVVEEIKLAFSKYIPEANSNMHRFDRGEYDILDSYLKVILSVNNGCLASFEEFFTVIDPQAKTNFTEFKALLESLQDEKNYCDEGLLQLESHELFKLFSESYQVLMLSTKKLREHLDTFGVSMRIKHKILDNKRNFVSTKAAVKEIRTKLRDYPHVTVAFTAKDGRLIPVGVIHREMVDRPVIGTVSLRDFCNEDEISLSPDVEVISAIDHHKSTLNSKQCMTISIADVQSCNVLAADKAFEINDRYGTANQSAESIDQQIADLQDQLHDSKSLRLLSQLLHKKSAILHANDHYFIDPQREYFEYMLFLNAIIDDTDLLNKAGWKDLECIAKLVNRMKSIIVGKSVEVISIAHYARTSENLHQAIQDLLVNDELYSFYKNIYQHRQEVVEEGILSISNYKVPECFVDRKIQNHSCSVSQFKIFPGNRQTFKAERLAILQKWISVNNMVKRKNNEVNFFLHMNSTIPGALEAYKGLTPSALEQDEIWLSVSENNEDTLARLRQFIFFFRGSPKFKKLNLLATVEGPQDSRVQDFEKIFQSFPNLPYEFTENNELEQAVIVFKFRQGYLNSRKADITPFLPV